MSFAKSMAKLNLKERSAVAIMGFNAPEWVISFMGGIMYNCVSTGIYITNSLDACHYQTEHSEASLVVCETNEHLQKFDLNKLPLVQAVVVWGEKELPAAYKTNPKVYLWKDFMKLGDQIKESAVMDKVNKQRPGQCCCLIYTSGTTGRPKGCMLSHDNLTWPCIPNWIAIRTSNPDMPISEHRFISYLPLSHIAGLAIDFCAQLFSGHQVFFARPDALAGTLALSLQWSRPTVFFGVPRVWEKFEEKLKEVAATKPAILQSISGWAKGYGAQKV
jgi:long-chain-fatty-acid--CoA ligase ACSBG